MFVLFFSKMKNFRRKSNTPFVAAVDDGSGSGGGGGGAAFTPAFFISTLFTLSLIALISVALWQAFSAAQANTSQNVRLDAVETGYVAGDATLNTSLCAKIMGVNSTLQLEIDALRSFLNITGNMTANFTQYVLNQLFDLHNEINNETLARLTKDMLIMANITLLEARDAALLANITALYSSVIFTVNGMPPASGNMNIVGENGINVTNSASTVRIKNAGIVTINSQLAEPASGNLQLIGQGMITVHPGNLTTEIVVDGTTLATAINNLDTAVSINSMKIAELNATDVNLQNQINAINMSSTIISLIMNDSTFNMTIMSLIVNITTLQMQVAALQAQLANATAFSVATGTIVPWSGTSATIPSGYLYCDGSAVSQALYPNLYTVLGCQYCPSMICSMSNFCVPDLRGKVPVGEGGSAFLTRGALVGAEQHTLSSAEMPVHTHTEGSAGGHSHPGSTTYNAGEHYHDLKLSNGCANSFGSNIQTQFYGATLQQVNSASGQASIRITGDQPPTPGANPTSCTDGGTVNQDYIQFAAGAKYAGDHFHNLGLSTDGDHVHTINSAGSGGAHNNIQPSAVVGAYMIKT